MPGGFRSHPPDTPPIGFCAILKIMKQSDRIRFYRRFSFKTFTALACIAIISVAVTAVSLSLVSGATMRRNVSQRNLQIARRAAEEISIYINASFSFLESLADMLMPVRDPWVVDLVLENAAVTYGKFQSIHLIDGDLEVLASSELDNRRAVFDREFVSAAAVGRGVSTSEVALSLEGLPYLTVVAPTRSSPWPRVYAELSLRDIWDLVDDISFGKTGRALLLSGNGFLIAHPDKTKILSMEGAEFLAGMPGDQPEGASYITRDEYGVSHLAAAVEIPALDWRLIIVQHLSEAYVPLKTILTSSSIVAAIAAAAALFGSFLLVRRYSKPLNRLIAGTELIREGKLDHRIEVDTDDEFGRLSGYFNSMVKELEEWSDKLAVSERKYRLLTENVNDIIFMVDDEARLLYCNNQAKAVTGHPAEILVGRSVAEFLDEKSRDLVSNFDIHGDTETAIEINMVTRSGSTVPLETRLVRVIDPSGEVFFYGVARNVYERKQAEARLEAYQQELRALASQLILTEARERKKIASLIHDRVGQALSLSRIKLGILNSLPLSGEEGETVGEIIGLIDQIIQDTRSLIFTISSPLLYDLGLSAALEKLAEQFDSEHDIRFLYEGPEQELEIDIDVSLLLFDAVKELLMNTVKHSGAGTVHLSMRPEGNHVVLTVKDDGIGFDPYSSGNGGKRSGGYGLFSIRERLDNIGGSCVVNSGDHGSQIVLSVPIGGKEQIEHSYSHR